RQRVRDVGDAAQADDGRHAENDQPERLGLLAGRGERGGGPAYGVDEGPHLDDKGRQPERLEAPGERGYTSREHPSRLSGPATVWAGGRKGGCRSRVSRPMRRIAVCGAGALVRSPGDPPGGTPGVDWGSGLAGPLLALVARPAVERALALAGAAPVEGLLPP